MNRTTRRQKPANPKEGDLRVWNMVNAISDIHYYAVPTPSAAKFLIDTLAQSQLQRDDVIMNAFGLEVYEGGEWKEWFDANDDDIDESELVELPDFCCKVTPQVRPTLTLDDDLHSMMTNFAGSVGADPDENAMGYYLGDQLMYCFGDPTHNGRDDERNVFWVSWGEFRKDGFVAMVTRSKGVRGPEYEVMCVNPGRLPALLKESFSTLAECAIWLEQSYNENRDGLDPLLENLARDS